MDYQDFSRQSMDDIVFYNRNKTYGAYALRESYQTHLLKAIGLTFGLFIFGLYSPKMANAMGFFNETSEPETIIISCPMIPLEKIYTVPEKPQVKQAVAPKQESSPTQRFTEVKPVDRTTPTDNLPKIDDLNNKAISNTTGDGTNKTPSDNTFPPDGDPSGSATTVIDTKEYLNVDQKPEFIGGHAAMKDFLKGILVYPKDELDNGDEGETIINFVVGIDGNVENVTVSQSSGYTNFDKEALRVIKKIGKRFKPGKINGKAVRSICSIPIDFTIE